MMFVYAIAFRNCAAADLGSWAFVLAYMALSRTSDVTIAPTVVRFTAKLRMPDGQRAAAHVILGGVRRVVARVGATSTVFMVCFLAYLQWAKEGPDRELLFGLVLLSWVYVGMLALATAVTAGLDGLKRTDLRAGAVILANVVRVVVTYFLMSNFGVYGFAIGLISYATVLFICAFLALWQTLPEITGALVASRIRWSDEMTEFSRGYQVAGLLQMFLEPCTKMLFPLFADLETLGYYDVASKFVQQLRAALVAPISILLASFSSSSSTHDSTGDTLYRQSSRLSLLFVSLCFSSLICVLPLLSIVWIGTLSEDFILFGYIFSVAWGLNAFSSVAYYYLVAVGQLKAVTDSNIVMAIMNVCCGVFGGWLFGGLGFGLGLALAIVSGSVMVIVSANSHLGVTLRSVVGAPNLWASGIGLTISSLCAMYLMAGGRRQYEIDSSGALGMMCVVAVVGLLSSGMCHLAVFMRMRHQISSLFTAKA